MNTLRLVVIAVVILCSLWYIGIVNAHITSMWIYAESDWGDGATLTADLTTDVGIDKIYWYINRNHEKTTHHNGATWVGMDLGTFPGHIKGEKYVIEAIVEFDDGAIDTATDKVSVSKPIITSRIGPNTGVDGSASVSSQYFDSSFNFGMSGSVWAYNSTEHTILALGWFRHQEWDGENGAFMDEERDTKDPDSVFKPGEIYYVYPDSMKIEFPHGRPMRLGEERFFNAHTHLQVGGIIDGKTRVDDWEADTKQQTGTTAVKFTYLLRI